MVNTHGVNIKNIYKSNKLSNKEKTEKVKWDIETFRLKESQLHEDLKWLSKHYCINSALVQKIITDMYFGIKSYIFNNGKLKYKSKDKYLKTTISAKSRTGMLLIKENNNYYIIYNSTHKKGSKNKLNLKLKVHINKHDTYLQQMLDDAIKTYKYVRLVRRCEKGKNKYYAQIVVPSVPPVKYNKQGEVKGVSNLGLETEGKGTVGIDIGTSTVATVSEKRIHKHELGCYRRRKESYKNKIEELNTYKRYLEKLRIKNNPEFYKSNGTRKSRKQVRKEGIKWKESRRMKKLRLKIKECYRLLSIWVKLDHNEFINDLIKEGVEFKVEDMNYQGLAKRSKKKTEKNKKTGKNKRKKRYGKSIGFHSPSLLISNLNRKLSYVNKEVIKVNTREVKASQYNHQTKDYKKKLLGDRDVELGIFNANSVNNDNKIGIDRDIYSAYLISQVEYSQNYVDRVVQDREKKLNRKLKKKEKDAINGWVEYNNEKLDLLFNSFVRLNEEYKTGNNYKLVGKGHEKIKRVVKVRNGVGLISEVLVLV